MSSGAMNINGDYLAWRYALGMTVGNLARVRNTIIYYPGYSLLDKRSKWCNGHASLSLCATIQTLYARLGTTRGGADEMLWRCYCSEALVPSKYSHMFTTSTAYRAKHSDLLAINGTL